MEFFSKLLHAASLEILTHILKLNGRIQGLSGQTESLLLSGASVHIELCYTIHEAPFRMGFHNPQFGMGCEVNFIHVQCSQSSDKAMTNLDWGGRFQC